MSSETETRDIPDKMRRAVDARDKGFCRMCGKFLGPRRAIHHINFGGDDQGMGGRRRHVLGNLVSLCWLPSDNDCHARAHSDKEHWRRLLMAVVNSQANLTAYQIARRTKNQEPS